jgi:small subunit ribosomal protein S8
MNMTDPIADMLTRIRNGYQSKLATVDVTPYSKIKHEIAKILKSEGYITKFSVEGEGIEKKIVVTLKYTQDGDKVMQGIKRISKPGLRVYTKSDNIPRVLNGLGVAIISTSQGMMTDREARKKHIGGEVIAYVW